MFKKEYKKVFVFVGSLLLIVLSFVFIFCLGSYSNLQYFELNDENQIQLKSEYIDIENLFGEERYTREEIKKVKQCAKKNKITPEEFVFASLMTNGSYTLDFENSDKVSEKIKELEKAFQKDISEIYKDHCEKDTYLDAMIRAKLSQKGEIKEKEIVIDGILRFKKVRGIAPAGLVGADFIKITLHDDIAEISANAFAFSNVQELYLGKETLKIGSDIFAHCNVIQRVYSSRFLGEFAIAGENTVFNDVFIFIETEQ